jgi:DNA-directed RNA polymerase subunit RPC12/RpoP
MDKMKDPSRKISCPYCRDVSEFDCLTEGDHLWVCSKCKELFFVSIELSVETRKYSDVMKGANNVTDQDS